jgi:hypothetical protein
MMDPSNVADKMLKPRKTSRLRSSRVLLTIAVWALLTVSLHAFTKLNFDKNEENLSGTRVIVVDDGQSGSHEDESVERLSGDGIALVARPRLVKRSVELPRNRVKPKIAESVESLNDVAPKLDNQHLKLSQRQGTNRKVKHRHSDGVVYYFKGYKCVPIHAPGELSRSTQRPGMLSYL